MLTPTQKQRLEEKVREAVPESMELKFGCRIKIHLPKKYEFYDECFYTKKLGADKNIEFIRHESAVIENRDYGSRGKAYHYNIGYDHDGYHSYKKVIIDAKLFEDMVGEGRIEILGRPLTLQDVLIALNKSGEMIGVDDDGSFRSYPDGSRIHTYGGIGCSFNGEYMPAYDLTKDYHHQSDEFYTFLYELLCK